MNFCSLIFVRYNSKRLPGKALIDISGHPSIYWLCRQLKHTPYPYIICTSDNPLDDVIVEFCEQNGILFFRGSEPNILDRMCGAIDQFELTHVARITGDDLFVDPTYLQQAVRFYDGSPFCFTDLPKGTDFQILSAQYLKELRDKNKKEDTEYLTWYFNSNPNKQFLRLSPTGLSTYGFELDTEKDLRTVRFVIETLKHSQYFKLGSLLQLADANPDLFDIKEVVDGRIEEI